jgi:integral membrane protein (TIGR01906 family)
VTGLLRVLERVLVAAALCVVVLAVAVGILTAPWFTRVVTSHVGIASSTGLSPDLASSTAQLVRRFVTSRGAPQLPQIVDGRTGFDASASSHLEDVREVFVGLRLLGAALAGALIVWFAASWRGRRFGEIGSSARGAAWVCGIAPILVAVAGAIDFEALFTVFHGFFFDEGTWTFPPDALLIELFPERFWMIAAASLALLVIAQGVGLWVAGTLILRTRTDAAGGNRGSS